MLYRDFHYLFSWSIILRTKWEHICACKKYFEKFKVYPNEITILTYDALGLIYYTWKKNGIIKSINDFSFKNKIKGKIGTFSFKNQKVIQELDIYKTENKKFVKF